MTPPPATRPLKPSPLSHPLASLQCSFLALAQGWSSTARIRQGTVCSSCHSLATWQSLRASSRTNTLPLWMSMRQNTTSEVNSIRWNISTEIEIVSTTCCHRWRTSSTCCWTRRGMVISWQDTATSLLSKSLSAKLCSRFDFRKWTNLFTFFHEGPQQMANKLVICKQPSGSSPRNCWRSRNRALDPEENHKEWRKQSEDVDNSYVPAQNLHSRPQTLQHNSGLWGPSSETFLLGHVFCTHLGKQAQSWRRSQSVSELLRFPR